MILVLEGPDGAGKTMLAEKLAKQMKGTIIHRVKPSTKKEKKLMFATYVEAMQNSTDGKVVIFDRCWYSELVYGTIMRDESMISAEDANMLERLLVSHKGIVIYCTGDTDDMWERCCERGETYITDKSKYVAICDMYDRIMLKLCTAVVLKYEYKEV